MIRVLYSHNMAKHEYYVKVVFCTLLLFCYRVVFAVESRARKPNVSFLRGTQEIVDVRRV